MSMDIQSLLVNINSSDAQMTKSFGPGVLVDFVNRWYVL